MDLDYNLKLIKNGEIYAPEYLGKKDILLFGGKVGYIKDEIAIPKDFVDIEIIDATDKYVVPGFMILCTYMWWGGGRIKTRTPEIQLQILPLRGYNCSRVLG